MRVSKQNPFEAIFQDFVLDFGGEVLPEAPNGSSADYFFRRHNLVAELKSLTVDQTNEISRKLTPKVLSWVRTNGQIPPGIVKGDQHFIAFKDMPREIQDFWLRLLKGSTEPLIRDANRQIRDTKSRMNLPSAKVILIIANEGNPYHDHPDSHRRLIAEILRKRTPVGDLRYPHINGAVCFSIKDVKSRDEGMYFWANLQMKQAPTEDAQPMADFQRDLQQAWYSYLERKAGIRVRQHSESSSQTSA
jgi:hypothetical protein